MPRPGAGRRRRALCWRVWPWPPSPRLRLRWRRLRSGSSAAPSRCPRNAAVPGSRHRHLRQRPSGRSAAGGVQIDYGPYKLVAKDIVYDQASRRLVASGDVELIEPTGNRIYADSIDVTDDFANGFVQALRIETPDNTRFAAGQAVRRDGAVTTFERGIYTACEACEKHPDRPPLWQVKARRIVWDQNAKVIRYYGARFELFGKPLAYLPYFASPDPTVKRQSGLLPPRSSPPTRPASAFASPTISRSTIRPTPRSPAPTSPSRASSPRPNTARPSRTATSPCKRPASARPTPSASATSGRTTSRASPIRWTTRAAWSARRDASPSTIAGRSAGIFSPRPIRTSRTFMRSRTSRRSIARPRSI